MRKWSDRIEDDLDSDGNKTKLVVSATNQGDPHMKSLLCTMALISLTGCPVTMYPSEHPEIGEPCPCDVSPQGMVIVQFIHSDNGEVGAYCAMEVGNPPLAACSRL